MTDTDEDGPGLFKIGCWVMLAIAVLSTGFWLFGITCGTVGNVTQTVADQFAPSVLLQKYEWFKDAHAQLDAKRANLQVYEQRELRLEKAYGKDRRKWPADERERADIWASEQAGIAASYNALAADYNAQMAKFNYRFTNVGDLPAGATDPLPRSVAPYTTTDRGSP